jgi:copper chaperone NosL
MKNKIGIISRVLLAVCAVALTAVLFVPLWKIDLIAPQYPEGLSLLIYPNKLAGNVDIINGLNHYIGMKTLHTSDFIEFTILPWLIGLYALLFLTAAIAGRKKVLYTVFILFLVFGIIAMVDFYKWEYNYGHNLNPDAAIQVPGMSYQPPLIGYKQLLNFSAYSFPHTGGWIFIGVGALALLCVVLALKRKKSITPKPALVNTVIAALLSVLLSSCSTAPEPIKTGIDGCTFCKMTISDVRYGAEIVSKKGKIFKFDDAHCVLAYLKKNIADKDIAAIYFTDFSGKHSLINVNEAFFLKSADLKSPMGGNVAAFSNKDSLQQVAGQFNGTVLSWAELHKQ